MRLSENNNAGYNPLKEFATITKAIQNKGLLSVSGSSDNLHFKEVGFLGYVFRLIKSKVFNDKTAFDDCKDALIASRIADFMIYNKDQLCAKTAPTEVLPELLPKIKAQALRSKNDKDSMNSSYNRISFVLKEMQKDLDNSNPWLNTRGIIG